MKIMMIRRFRAPLLALCSLFLLAGQCDSSHSISPDELSALAEDVEQREKDRFVAITKRPTRIALVSHSTLDIKYIRSAIDNHRRYAAKHGYDYVFRNNLITTRFLDGEAGNKVFRFGLYWQKIQAVTDALYEEDASGKPLYDYVVWVDADAIFTNFDITFEEVIERFGAGKDFLIANEGFSKANTGVFIVRNSAFGRQMMEDIAITHSEYKHKILPEQFAVSDYIHGYVYKNPRGEIYVEPIEERTYDRKLLIRQASIVPQRVLNSWYEGWFPFAFSEEEVWQPGDFIAHFAVAKDRNRVLQELLQCFLDKGGENYETNTAYKECF